MTTTDARKNWHNLFSKENTQILPESIAKGKQTFENFMYSFDRPNGYEDRWETLPVREQYAWIAAAEGVGKGTGSTKDRLAAAQEESTVEKLFEKALKDALRGNADKAEIVRIVLPAVMFWKEVTNER